MMLGWIEIVAIAVFMMVSLISCWATYELRKKLIKVQTEYPEQLDIEYVPEDNLPENVVKLRPVNPFRLLAAEFLALESHLEKTDSYTYNRIRLHLMRKARIMLGVRE